jgi:flagellar basal body-associated protein FliL
MGDLIWLIFISLIVVLVIAVLWFIWRLRHFSQSHNQTVLDDKLMQSMLGDEALSQELKNALIGKASQQQAQAQSQKYQEHPAENKEGEKGA